MTEHTAAPAEPFDLEQHRRRVRAAVVAVEEKVAITQRHIEESMALLVRVRRTLRRAERRR